MTATQQGRDTYGDEYYSEVRCGFIFTFEEQLHGGCLEILTYPKAQEMIFMLNLIEYGYIVIKVMKMHKLWDKPNLYVACSIAI
jgi:hypothetical protein